MNKFFAITVVLGLLFAGCMQAGSGSPTATPGSAVDASGGSTPMTSGESGAKPPAGEIQR